MALLSTLLLTRISVGTRKRGPKPPLRVSRRNSVALKLGEFLSQVPQGAVQFQVAICAVDRAGVAV